MALKVIDVKAGIFDENDRIAEKVRAQNREHGVFMINIMSSPGAGKTTTLLRTIDALKEEFRIGVKEADIQASVDAEKMAAAGARTIQVHTGGECAMDASMVEQTLDQFDTSELDLLFLENVGNLVCTAEQDTGAHVNVEILSIPEGDDKPLKYPLMFRVCQCVLVNKTDTREYFPFDDAAVTRRIRQRNPKAEIFFVSAKTGEGIAALKERLGAFAEALKKARQADRILVPYESAENMGYTRQTLSSVKEGSSVAVFIGPEGGFDPKELELLEKAGAGIP